MKQGPRAHNKLFAEIFKAYGLTKLKSNECFFVKMVNNSKSLTTSLMLVIKRRAPLKLLPLKISPASHASTGMVPVASL